MTPNGEQDARPEGESVKPLGWVVIDERFRLPVVSIRLCDGLAEVHASAWGPIEALREDDYQFMLLGEDGIELLRQRRQFGWHAVDVGASLTFVLPWRTIEVVDQRW